MSFDERSALLWDVVLGEASWEEVLRQIAASTGAAMALMVRRGPDTWRHWWREAGAGDVDAHALLDPSRNPITRGMDRAEVGRVLDRRDLISDAAFRSNGSLAPLRAHGAFHALLCKVEGGEGASAAHTGFGIGFPEHRADACSAHAQDFALWIGPLQRALRTYAVLEAAEVRARACFDVLGMTGVAAIAVAGDLTILQANAEAEHILAAGDGIERRLGRLELTPRDRERLLQRRIRGASLAPALDDGPITALRRSGLPSYGIEVIPVPRLRAEAILLITDPLAAGALSDPRRLAHRLGLTPAEARVARLAPLALTKAGIAEQLGISENTVKTHLAAIRAKTGARNMVQIALLVRGA